MRDVVTLYLRASATEAQPLVYAVGHTYISRRLDCGRLTTSDVAIFFSS